MLSVQFGAVQNSGAFSMKYQFLSILRRVFFIAKAEPFGSMVRLQPEDLSHTYPFTYSIVSAYLPTKKGEYDNFTNALLPEGLETVPKRFAISYRNKWMLEQSDIVITYVARTYGGAWQFKAMAERQGKTVIELSE